MALRTATADDWRELVPSDADQPEFWIGLVYVEGDRKLGIGVLHEGEDGRWWIGVRTRARRPIALWKGALELLGTAKRAGVTVHAIADPDVGGSEIVLSRLGFVMSSETIVGHPIWTQ